MTTGSESGAVQLAGHGEPPVPAIEARRAIEDTKRLLAEALHAVDAEDDEKLTHAYELAAECADHIARGLWFLRSAEREREGASAG